MKIATWLRKKQTYVWIALALPVVALVLFGAAQLTGDWQGLLLNLITEAIGAVATYFIFVRIIGRREERQAEKQQLEARKADLIHQMGSSSRDVAVPAAEELRRHRWLTDGSLRGADLPGANLQEAGLGGANLQGALLSWANLQKADLSGANLQEAYLWGANLQGAYLVGAKLQRADLPRADLGGAYLVGAFLQRANLGEANLQRANLSGANLQGAYLHRANLQGAYLEGADLRDAKFNEDTTLPDGTNWKDGTDLARFTDPDHPDYWKPPWVT